MAQKTTVAIRFTKPIHELRRVGFVDELSKLIVFKLRARRPKKDDDRAFQIQWFRLPEDELAYAANIWGQHETVEVREVVSEVAEECVQKELPVVLDVVME